jgi:glycosyltransferase involved in cell wall biosynthesis
MVRVAFTLIGGRNWTGGYNYLLNLTRVLAGHPDCGVTPVLFFGTDADSAETAPFKAIQGAEIVHAALFNGGARNRILADALVRGRHMPVVQLFRAHKIDVMFEAANYFGWRSGSPTIAWMPDIQHRVAPQMFTRFGGLKRELGFRAQIASGHDIMLSSDHARQTCEHFYPATRGRTHVVRFAVGPQGAFDPVAARAVADSYDLPERFFYLPNQFWKHKNHLQVLDALIILRERGHRIVVAASGKQMDGQAPEYFPHVLSVIKANRLEQEFRLLGLIPYAHLAALMQAGVALINPSTYEGWSTTVEEARAMGVPMVLSDIPVHREQVGDGAAFFNLGQPQSLADVLQGFQPLDVSQRGQLASAGAATAVQRTGQFAAEFADLARACLVRSVARSGS